MAEDKPRIFIYCIEHEGQLFAQALAEDGSALVQEQLEHRIHAPGRLLNNIARASYNEHYPDGFNIINLTLLKEHELYLNKPFLEALNKNAAARQA